VLGGASIPERARSIAEVGNAASQLKAYFWNGDILSINQYGRQNQPERLHVTCLDIEMNMKIKRLLEVCFRNVGESLMVASLW
jgi:hypothetical protein